MRLATLACALAFGIACAAPLALADAANDQAGAPVAACDTDAQCAELPACALKPGCDGTPATAPFRLVGYGCAGSRAPLYRDEEDEFPAGGCARIEPTF